MRLDKKMQVSPGCVCVSCSMGFLVWLSVSPCTSVCMCVSAAVSTHQRDVTHTVELLVLHHMCVCVCGRVWSVSVRDTHT